MVAFALVILVFVYWSVVGFALVSTLYKRPNLLQNALLSPLTGVAANVLLVVWLNCAGLPVRYAGPITTLILLSLSVILLMRARPVVPGKWLLRFAGVLFIGALATGYPFLVEGFNWVSYANDDMANYSLGAKYFLNHGHFTVPSPTDVAGDRDVSLIYWLFYVVAGIRHGVDELLAWLASCTGLPTLQVFMPLIVALHLVLIASGGALVLQDRRQRRAALFTCLAMGLSALVTLGTVYQLLGQVAGLACLAGVSAVLLRPLKGIALKQWCFISILVAALSTIYPEVIPFVVLSCLPYHLLLLIRRRESFRQLAAAFAFVGALSLVLLNVTVIVTISTLLGQAKSGTAATPVSLVLFPYYLTPAGFAYMWGFFSFSYEATGRLLDVAILFGAALFALAVLAGIYQAFRQQAVAFVWLVMAGLSLQLFRNGSDFGLYKLAMFLQPFVLGTLTVTGVEWYGRMKSPLGKAACVVPLGILVGWSAMTQFTYTGISLGDGDGGMVELPHASRTGLLSDLVQLENLQGTIVSDTSNVVLAKYQAAHKGPIIFASKDFFAPVFADGTSPGGPWRIFYRVYEQYAVDVAKRRQAEFVAQEFNMHSALPSPNRFVVRRSAVSDGAASLIETNTGVVNRRRRFFDDNQLIKVVPQQSVSNYLLFVSSQFGNTYYLAGADRPLGRVSMYRPEPDYFLTGKTMVSLGRDSLFRVLNATAEPRLVLEYTASLNADGDNRIPLASAIGEDRHMFAVEGRGSARLFSEPLRLQKHEGGDYVALDMGAWGKSFPDRRSKIMNLYGRDLVFDGRRVVGFARDVSLISNDEYRSLSAPSSVGRLPADLEDRALEYCGVYEDGWLSEASYFVLGNPGHGETLVVSVMTPELQGRLAASWVSVLLDGKEIGRRTLESGKTTMRFRVEGRGRQRVELRFDQVTKLPGGDGRPVSARLLFVGFTAATAEADRQKAQ